MTLFLLYLARQLDREEPGWQETTTILVDNAAWHTSSEIKQRLVKMQLPIIYLGPYSYSAAPVELVFAAIKLGDLNRQRQPTGKK